MNPTSFKATPTSSPHIPRRWGASEETKEESLKRELEQAREVIKNLQDELEKTKAQKRVFLSQNKIDQLATTTQDAQLQSSIGPIIKWLNETRTQPSDQFWTGKGGIDVHQIDQLALIYNNIISESRSDLEGFNGYIRAWNKSILDIVTAEKVKEWLVDSHTFPKQINKLVDEVTAFKQSITSLLLTNFLTFEKENLPALSQNYTKLLSTFEKIEKEILALEKKSEFPSLLKKMYDIVNPSDGHHFSLSAFSAIRATNSLTAFKFDAVDAAESNGWVTESFQQIAEHEKTLYRQTLDSTCKNWFFVIKEVILLRSTMQCLGETIQLILPIRELQTNTVGMRSLSKTTIDASRQNTKKTTSPDLVDLSGKLTQLEVSFKTSLKKKIEIENVFVGATKRLEETNTSLIGRLNAQSNILQQYSSEAATIKNQIESLQRRINEEQVLLSSDLNAAWKEISEKLPETAGYLDQIDYAVKWYKGYIPKDAWFFGWYYRLYSGRFFKLFTEPNMRASSPDLLINSDTAPAFPPIDEDPITKDIPIQILDLNDKK